MSHKSTLKLRRGGLQRIGPKHNKKIKQLGNSPNDGSTHHIEKQPRLNNNTPAMEYPHRGKDETHIVDTSGRTEIEPLHFVSHPPGTQYTPNM